MNALCLGYANLSRLDWFQMRNQVHCQHVVSVQWYGIYSSKDADILNYRKGLIAFYETGDYSPYADYFLNKQVERIKEIE